MGKPAKPKGPPRRKYTDAQKAEALAIYTEHGPKHASRELGIPWGTITQWASKAGLERTTSAKTILAALITRRAAFQVQVQDTLELTLARIHEAVGYEATPEEILAAVAGHDSPTHAAYRQGRKESISAKDWAVVYGILTDKIRLELGQATGREEVVSSPRHQLDARMDELAARRKTG